MALMSTSEFSTRHHLKYNLKLQSTYSLHYDIYYDIVFHVCLYNQFDNIWYCPAISRTRSGNDITIALSLLSSDSDVLHFKKQVILKCRMLQTYDMFTVQQLVLKCSKLHYNAYQLHLPINLAYYFITTIGCQYLFGDGVLEQFYVVSPQKFLDWCGSGH